VRPDQARQVDAIDEARQGNVRENEGSFLPQPMQGGESRFTALALDYAEFAVLEQGGGEVTRLSVLRNNKRDGRGMVGRCHGHTPWLAASPHCPWQGLWQISP